MVVHLHSQDRKTREYIHVVLNSVNDHLLNKNCIQSCFAVVKIIVRLLP